MKIKSFISKALVATLFLSNLVIDVSADDRYEIFNDNFVTINDNYDIGKKDVEIEGNTLVNVAGKGFKERDKYSQLHGGNLDDESYVRFTMDTSDKRAFRKLEYTPIKPSTIYTIFVEIKENTIQGTGDYLHVLYPISNTPDSAFNDIWGISALEATIGIHKRLVTTKSSFDGVTSGIRSYLRHIDGGSGYITYRIWLLEGNHIDEDIPYFEDIKSVGEQENNVINIASSNKNLFNTELEYGTYHYATGQKIEHKLEMRSANSMRVKPNTTYNVSTNADTVNVGIYQYDKDFNFISSDYHSGNNITFRTNSNCYYLNIRIRNRDLNAKVQIEEGDIKTEYTAPLYDNKNIILKEPLRSLPNGVKDKIVKKNGQWFIERNCAEVILNGSENWLSARDNNTANHNKYVLVLKNPLMKVYSQGGKLNVISDKFASLNADSCVNKDIPGISSRRGNNEGGIIVSINNTISPDMESFKNWLQSNNLKVVYEMASPIYEPLNISPVLNMYEERTHISNISEIPSNINVVIDRVVNRAIEFSELAKSNPTINNVSMARSWINLIDESLYKDKLQEEVNNITSLDDMELERKNMTVNLDLYIKCENVLSMTLNTNSITFEDFSGIEDMIKENAVNISINSSLPYQLNAYLPVEIQNADKTNTMDKSILNIKENSEVDYKEFVNINEKVVLKDNCYAGNDLLHGIDIKLKGGIAHEKDVYKTTIKFEAEQK